MNALNLYQEVVAVTGGGDRIKKVNEEVDKHKNPNRYLLEAVLSKNTVEARYLIGLGGDKNLADANGNSLMHITVTAGAPVDEGKQGWSPLMAAVLIHDADLVEKLIRHKANVNLTGIHNWTALHFAARENQPKLIGLLLRSGADLKMKDEWGRTARKVARENEVKDALKVLK